MGMVTGGVAQGRPNPLHFKLPTRLRLAREAADFGGVRLSLDAGLSRATVLRIEDEGRIPGIDVVEKLARVLKVSPCQLAFGLAGGGASPHNESLACDGVGARLVQAREAKGWSRRALGRESQTSDTTIRLTEEGETMPSVATVEQLAKVLRVSPCWLAYGEGSMEPPPRRRKTVKRVPPAGRLAAVNSPRKLR